MDARAIVDTGRLVALMNRRDSLHEWAVGVLGRVRGPYVATEGNVTEICHLLEREQVKGSLRFYELLRTRTVLIVSLAARVGEVQAHVARYRDRTVGYAEACLLALSDENPRLPIITTDAADFAVYLRHRSGRDVVMPGLPP